MLKFDEKSTPVLVLHFTQQFEFANVAGTFCYRGEDDNLRSYGGDHPLSGLAVSCQLDDRAVRPYAFTVAYQGGYIIDLPRAASMFTTLTKIEKAVSALQKKAYYGDSFGGFLSGLLPTMGIKEVVLRFPGSNGLASYTVMDGARLVDNYIAEKIRDWSEVWTSED